MKSKLLLAALAVMTVAGSAAIADDDHRGWHHYRHWGYNNVYVQPAPVYNYGYGEPMYIDRHDRRWIRHHEFEGYRGGYRHYW